MQTMKQILGLSVVLLAMVACANEPAPVASPSVVTVTASPTTSPVVEPEKATLATIRGPFNGTCTLTKSVGPVDSYPQQPARWKFHPQGDQKLQLFSKSGGYTMKLDRTAPTKFYGAVIQGSGWQFAYAIKIMRFDLDGFAQGIEVVTHDTAPGGAARENYLCRLRAGSLPEESVE
jgi:hypothetical protein